LHQPKGDALNTDRQKINQFMHTAYKQHCSGRRKAAACCCCCCLLLLLLLLLLLRLLPPQYG
jgi:hypothetical protein